VALKWSHNHRCKKLRKEAEGNYYAVIEDTRLYKYAMEEAQKDPSIDFFVFGHQHKPMQYKTGEHALTTVVGNWIRDYTYAVFDGETMSLRHYKQSEAESRS
jgi:UDP-2,3-diacylglucosamine hydrolase